MKMKKKTTILTKMIAFLLVIGTIISIQSPVVMADETPSSATGFTYGLTFPDSQVQDDLGYYHLTLSSGQTEELVITLNNPSTESIEVEVGLNGAKTNQNGVIEYGDTDIDNDPSLKVPFEDVVNSPDSITLAAGETKQLTIEVTMPEEPVEGLIAGGIQLMRKDQGSEAETEGSMVINQYAYVIAVLLQEQPVTILPDLALNKVFADQSNYRNTVFIDFSNVEANYLNDMTVETKIRAKGQEAILFERVKSDMRMAPNSFIQFPVSMNGEPMVPGLYSAHTIVTSGEQRWEWDEDFEITAENAKLFNERDVELVQEDGRNWWLLVLILLVILFLGFGAYILWKKRNEQAEETEEHQEK